MTTPTLYRIHHALRWLTVILLVFLGVQAAHFAGVFKPRPYFGVIPVLIKKEANELVIVADFQKGNCERIFFQAYGVRLGAVSQLNHRDIDGRAADPAQPVDRVAGAQTLSIAVDLEGNTYDAVELRTRHLCEGHRVDKLFLRIPV